MTAPPFPDFSEMSISNCCSEEEGSNGNADPDYCSPEMKRVKRLDSAEPSPRNEVTPKKEFLKTKFLGEVEESESRLSFRSLGDHHKSCNGIEFNRNSNHSLPNLDFKALTLSSPAQHGHQLSVENVLGDRTDSGQFERRSSLEGIFGHRVDDEAELKNDRKARVVSSYYNHFKVHQQLGSDRGSLNTGSTVPSHFPEVSESTNEASNDGFDTGNEVLDKETVKMKLGLSEMTYESVDEHIRKIPMPAPLETLIGSRENYESWSTTNSLPEDDPQNRLNSAATAELGSEATETAHTPVRNAGDSQTWNSNVEKEYKNELEFSTLVTLAYVRVRDLTNTINKASCYLEAIDRKEGEEVKETNELRSEVQAMFEERANLALEHSKWRSEMSELYQLRKKALSNLKSQAALAEQAYFTLRKELEDLQNEPVVTKPKRSWFSRMCAFIK